MHRYLPSGFLLHSGVAVAEQLLHWRDWKANASPGIPIVTARTRQHMQRSWGPKSANKLALLDMTISADQSSLLDQIFQFIGSKPEEAVSRI